MAQAIKVENVGKRYRLGIINRDMLYKDIQSWWAGLTGKPDPNAKISFQHAARVEKGDEFWALRNVSLEIEEGEVFGIIGKNGAGKSTLLKILSQITAPTEGRVKMRGRVASLLEVGTGFHPELTGRENVFLNGAILGMSRREVSKKFDEIVDFSEVSEFIDTPVKRYSSGMYVRLAFGVAAHLDPDILIIDEVLAVGDASFQKKCIGKMSKVAKEGRTVILVTHSMALAETLAERCAWLNDGEVHAIGRSRDIVKAYLGNTGSSAIDVAEGLRNHRLRRGPGHVRLFGFSLSSDENQIQSQFLRGDTIRAFFQARVFKNCKNLAIAIGFKHGLSGECLLSLDKLCVSQGPLLEGQELEFSLQIDTGNIPAAVYDLYLWLGPYGSDVMDEYYDILDGLVAPVTILESDDACNNLTRVPARLENAVVLAGTSEKK